MQPHSRVVPEARGRALEIGIGSGLDLSLYDPTRVSEIVGVDPAAGMQRLPRQRAAQIRIPVRTIALELGQIQAQDASFDSIVFTYTLCSIPDAQPPLRKCVGCSNPAANCCSANMARRLTCPCCSGRID